MASGPAVFTNRTKFGGRARRPFWRLFRLPGKNDGKDLRWAGKCTIMVDGAGGAGVCQGGVGVGPPEAGASVWERRVCGAIAAPRIRPPLAPAPQKRF